MNQNQVGKQCFSSHSPGSYSRFLLIIISKELSSPKNPKVMISVSIFVISSYLSTQVHCLKYLDAKLSASQCVPMWGTYLLHIFINLPSPPPVPPLLQTPHLSYFGPAGHLIPVAPIQGFVLPAKGRLPPFPVPTTAPSLRWEIFLFVCYFRSFAMYPVFLIQIHVEPHADGLAARNQSPLKEALQVPRSQAARLTKLSATSPGLK